MTWHLTYFALEVIGFFSIVVVGARELASKPNLPTAQLFALLCLDSACARILARHEYAFWIPEAFRIDVGILQTPMDLARNLTPGIFMILCHAMFQDRPRFSRTLLALFGVQMLLDGIRAIASPMPLNAALFNALPAVLQLMFVSLGIAWIVGGWRADLIEHRRKLRWTFLLLFGSLVFVMVLLERLLLPWRDASIFHAHVVLSVLGTCFSTGAVLFALFVSPATFVDLSHPMPSVGRVSPAQAAPADITAPRKENLDLLRLLRDEHIYREAGLTIGSLAARLRIPEYRLRRLIHESLGYRNFNAMLHDYRIEEAAALLADESKAHLTILTIALSVGYSSINPFNRAFRELKGMAPSVFRSQRRAVHTDSFNTLTDS